MNEIDLWQDLEFCERMLKTKLSPEDKKMWLREHKEVIKQLKENYPNMFWDNK